MDFVIIAGTIAAIVAAFASVKALFPKAKPRIIEGEVYWPDEVFPNRLDGSIIVANDGTRICSILSVQAVAVGFSIKTSSVTSEFRLPRSLGGYGRETLSFRCCVQPADSSKVGVGPPEDVTVKIEFDCKKKPIAKKLYRASDTLK